MLEGDVRTLGAVLVAVAAALIIAVLVYLLAVVPGQREPLVAPTDTASTDEPAPSVHDPRVTPTSSLAATPITFSQLAVGTCLLDTHLTQDDTVAIDKLESVDCSLPHYEEAILLGQLDIGDYPGQQALIDELDRVCFVEFAAYVGVDYTESALLLDYLYPTESSWNAGDRAFACLVYGEQELVGSVAGSAQ